MKKEFLSAVFMGCLMLASCTAKTEKEMSFIQENVSYSEKQMQNMLESLGSATKENYPRTSDAEGKLKTTSIHDWTPGFFPGTLWYLYELTGNEQWKTKAEEWTYPLEQQQFLKSNHDVGFVMYCSYGNAERLASKPDYKEILVQSAKSLCTRYNDTIKATESWDYRKAWNGEEWFYPVIIDNMMNLELLCYASKVTNDATYKQIAINHANTTLKNHFREDHSSYHVVDYDMNTGEAIHKQTCQGYSDNSVWSRGQAWAVYGYTMMYRETGNKEYLTAAKNFADYYIKHLPEDLVPYWDFNAGQEGYTPDGTSNAKNYMKAKVQPRDASAASIVCSALFELGEMSGDAQYTDMAIKMLKSLASPSYRAPLGENANFIVMHCTGSLPHKAEIDKPLVYADYYFVEALVRYKRLLETGSVLYAK